MSVKIKSSLILAMLSAWIFISCEPSLKKIQKPEVGIDPVRNASGDTVETGVAKNIQGLVTPYDTLKLKKIIAKAPSLQVAHPNVFTTPLPTIQHLSIPDTMEVDSSFLLEKFIGDTVTVSHPIPVKATTTKFKDAAVFNMPYLSTENGLYASFSSAVVEDSKGNVWIGNSGVLSKINGENVSYYSENEGFSDFIIWTVIEDSKGDIWIGTDGGGLLRYDGTNCIHYTKDDGLISNSIITLKEDSKGNIWIGMNALGYQMFDGENLTTVTEEVGFDHYVSSFIEDDLGNIWMGTFKGLIKFDQSKYYLFDDTHGMQDKSIRSLAQGKSGEIWIGSSKGYLMKYNGHGFINYSFETCRGNAGIRGLVATEEDVWIGTIGNGLVRFNEKEVTYYTTDVGLAHNNVWALFEDKLSNLWVGSDGGLNYFDYSSYSQLTVNNGLGDNYVWSITSDDSGDKWMATHTGGVNVYNGSSMFNYRAEHGLLQDECRSIFKDSKGDIWIGSASGLTMYDGVYFHHFDDSNGFIRGLVVTIFEDSKQNLWFGTQGHGVIKFDGERFTQYAETQGLSSPYVFSLGEDEENNIWIGTFGGGVNKLEVEEDRLTVYSTKEGLSDNVVWHIGQLSTGDLALGTKKGLDIWDGNGFSHYLVSGENMEGEIQGFTMAQDNKLWVTTDKGIYISTKSISSEPSNALIYPATMISLNKEDGLKDAYFLQNSIFIDDSNFFWAGNGKGLLSIDIDSFKFSNSAPEISINSVDLEQKHIDYNNKIDLIEKGIANFALDSVVKFQNVPKSLSLPYNLNHLTFHFSARDWIAPAKLRYSFRINGLENEWSLPSKEAKADYRNLPPGDYVFQVKAKGESELWSRTSEFSFTITPPFWKTWWAFIIYVFIGMTLVYLIIRRQTLKLKTRQEELQLEIKKATLDMRVQKEVVEQKNKEITDSITYAKRIQTAILPTIKTVKQGLQDCFIAYYPKDIVAGDFYWVETLSEQNSFKEETKLTQTNDLLFAVADCTGHGVPGAMVSVVCINALNRSVREFNLKSPSKILDKTREIVIEEFGKSEEQVRDGMDIALCRLQGRNLTFSGANNPAWIIRDKEMIVLKATKQPIGKYQKTGSFIEEKIELKKDDMLYIFSDGYADQFGGHKGKKMKSSNFKKLLLSISEQPVQQQELRLKDAFEGWKGELEQIDDICIIGVRIQ